MNYYKGGRLFTLDGQYRFLLPRQRRNGMNKRWKQVPDAEALKIVQDHPNMGGPIFGDAKVGEVATMLAASNLIVSDNELRAIGTAADDYEPAA